MSSFPSTSVELYPFILMSIYCHSSNFILACKTSASIGLIHKWFTWHSVLRIMFNLMRMYGMSHQNDPKLWLKEDSWVLLLLSLFLLMITANTFRETRNPFSFFWPIDEHGSEQQFLDALLNDYSVSFYVHKNLLISFDMHIIITNKLCHTVTCSIDLMAVLIILRSFGQLNSRTMKQCAKKHIFGESISTNQPNNERWTPNRQQLLIDHFHFYVETLHFSIN